MNLNQFKTIVKIFDQNGNLEYDGHNITVLPGRLALIEQMFTPSLNISKHLTLDSILQTQYPSMTNPSASESSDTTDVNDYNNRKAVYFGIGTGGINSMSPLTLSMPKSYETRLYNMVPFRFVPINSDISHEERENYRIRRVVRVDGDDYYAYFLKKFTVNPIEVVKSNGVDYQPDYDDSDPIIPGSPTPHPLENTSILTSISFELNVGAEDFKEFYRVMHNDTLENAKLSEFGLVMANEKSVTDTNNVTYDEVYNAELLSKVVHSPAYMDQEENSKRISYQIFS